MSSLCRTLLVEGGVFFVTMADGSPSESPKSPEILWKVVGRGDYFGILQAPLHIHEQSQIAALRDQTVNIKFDVTLSCKKGAKAAFFDPSKQEGESLSW